MNDNIPGMVFFAIGFWIAAHVAVVIDTPIEKVRRAEKVCFTHHLVISSFDKTSVTCSDQQTYPIPTTED